MKIRTLHTFYLIILCFLAGQINTYSQNSLIDWTAESNLIVINGVGITTSSTLTKLDSSFVWEQNVDEQTETNTFVINQVSGEWDSQSSLGEMTYTLTLDEWECQLQIIGSSNGITMLLTIFKDTVPDLYSFEIHTFNPF